MNLGLGLACAALGGSSWLVLQDRRDGLRIAALAVSALQVLLFSGVLHLHLRGLSLLLWTGVALAAMGALLLAKASQKAAVTAATAVLLVGVVQLLEALHFVGPG